MHTSNRRAFLQSTSAILGLGGLSGLASLSPALAELKSTMSPIRVESDLLPLMKLIRATPAEKTVPVMLEQIKKGTPYRQLLAASFMLTIQRGTTHSVYVTHAVNQLSLDAGREERLLPLLWHVDNLKTFQGFAHLTPSPKGPLPPPEKASSMLDAAMKKSDDETAAPALIQLARTEGPRQAFHRLWSYAAAYNRGSIGHAAIGASNAYRTLETIGWRHAEPVLRYVAYSCVHRDRNGYGVLTRENAKRSKQHARLPRFWQSRRSDRGAVLELLSVFRQGNPVRGCQVVFEQLLKGKMTAGTIWDVIFLTSSEMMMCTKTGGSGGRGLHSCTGMNALHYSFRTTSDVETRLFILLEAVEWTITSLQRQRQQGELRNLKITAIPAVDGPKKPTDAVEEIFSLLPPRRAGRTFRDRSRQDKACALTYVHGKQNPRPQLFLSTARRLLCLKSTGAHDFKFPVAIFENMEHVSAEWRPHLLAASVHYLHGTEVEDSATVRRSREALK